MTVAQMDAFIAAERNAVADRAAVVADLQALSKRVLRTWQDVEQARGQLNRMEEVLRRLEAEDPLEGPRIRLAALQVQAVALKQTSEETSALTQQITQKTVDLQRRAEFLRETLTAFREMPAGPTQADDFMRVVGATLPRGGPKRGNP